MQEKLSPRQRLINMMYLVLFALLALNIQVDFIDAFYDLSTSIERTVDKIELEQEQRIISITSAFEIDSITYLKSYRNSIKAQVIANKATRFIDSLRNELIDRTGGFNEYGYPKNSIDPSISDFVFIQRKGAKRLKEILQKSKLQFFNLLPENQIFLLQDIYEASDYIVNSRGKRLNWEEYHFNNLALGGSLALLSRFKNDVTIMESVILNFYLNDIYGELTNFIVASEGDSVKIDMAVINPESFKVGDEIKIRIQLPKFTKINKTNIVLFDKNNKIVEDAKINKEDISLSYSPIKAGIYTMKTDFLDENNKVTSSISKDFEVYDLDNIQYIYLDDLIKSQYQNSLYLGIKNKLEVEHPTFAFNQLTLQTNNGSIKKHKKSFIIMPERAGKTVVSLQNNNIHLTSKTFTVKTLPDPEATINNSSNNDISSKLFKIQTALSLTIKGFDFAVAYQIINFSLIRINAKGEKIYIGSNKTAFFNSEVIKQVRSANSKDVFIFHKINVKSADGISRLIPSLVLNIK
jgi:gliding motility-associated protein GldM